MQKGHHSLSRKEIIPLPTQRANPETEPDALFPIGSVGKENVYWRICPTLGRVGKSIWNKVRYTNLGLYHQHYNYNNRKSQRDLVVSTLIKVNLGFTSDFFFFFSFSLGKYFDFLL